MWTIINEVLIKFLSIWISLRTKWNAFPGKVYIKSSLVVSHNHRGALVFVCHFAHRIPICILFPFFRFSYWSKFFSIVLNSWRAFLHVFIIAKSHICSAHMQRHVQCISHTFNIAHTHTYHFDVYQGSTKNSLNHILTKIHSTRHKTFRFKTQFCRSLFFITILWVAILCAIFVHIK